MKTNFFKTELELGHCLRLPQEGPCECDLYLTCAKFVTTPAYAPRLRERRRVELALAEEAARSIPSQPPVKVVKRGTRVVILLLSTHPSQVVLTGRSTAVAVGACAGLVGRCGR